MILGAEHHIRKNPETGYREVKTSAYMEEKFRELEYRSQLKKQSKIDVIVENNAKVNRALCGAALSLGTNVEIIDTPGYSPLSNDLEMMHIAKEAAELIVPDVNFYFGENLTDTGSTDMGDPSCIMPVVHPYCPGMRGNVHGNDYEICDPESACIKSAQWQLAMLRLLLGDGAKRARRIIADFKPQFASKEEFLKHQDSLSDSGDRINHTDGKAEVRL